jgi:aminoglycoside 6'-N-acetyltransferase
MKNTFCFRPLDFSDIPLMYDWFNLPHVQNFYSLRQWTESEVLNKLKPYVDGSKLISGFIALMNDNPIGYVQKYRIVDYPWPNQNLSRDIINHAAGMDLFIGDEALTGKGIGRELIQSFIENHIWPSYQYCIVDPDINNITAIKCYEKLKFKEHTIINTKDALDRSVNLKLMILKR